ncbi:MFS transporter-like protein [Leptodontidium sp. MPI-SDFR-AT-0119]|nr:MFS transporter-like protein [Leptodontidium sp. MPI-SDFR-AT-0119]
MESGDRSRAIFIAVTVSFVIASIFAAGRVVSRFVVVKRHGWDDYTFILAWILAFGLTFAVNFGTSKGLGLHNDSILPAWTAQLLAAEYAAIVLFTPALVVTKISILLLYLDIAKHQTFFRIASYAILSVVVIGGVTISFLAAFHCSPVQAAYNADIKNFKCISIQKTLLASAPINIGTDLAILVLPIPLLTTLPLPLLRKSVLILSFIFGVIFVAAVDVTRIYYLQLATIGSNPPDRSRLSTGLDFSFNAGLALLWSAIEVDVAILGASIPTLVPLLKRLIPMNGPESQAGPNGTVFLNELPRRPSWTADPGSKPPFNSISTSLPREQESPANTIEFSVTQSTETGTQQLWACSTPRLGEHSSPFGFINMDPTKCIADMRGSESVKYCAIINTCMFLNGFTYTMLFSVNGNIPIIHNRIQAIGISSASYGGAGIFSPFLGYAILHVFGFKTTILASLAICCAGTLMFWPSGALGSYAAFIISNVVVGISLTCLEMAADTFNALCGPPEFAEIRVLLGTGTEGMGGVLSLILAKYAISINTDDTRSLISLQWAFFVITLFTVVLGLVFYYIPLPEATSQDLQRRQDLLWTDPSKKYLRKFPVIFAPLALAAMSSFFTAGALASLRSFIGSVLSSISTSSKTAPMVTISDFQLLLTVIYAVGSYFFAFLCFLIPPRYILFWAHACGIVFAVLITRVQFSSVRSVQVLTLVLSIFLGPTPNLSFGIAFRGLGQWTKLAGCIVIGISSLGACVWPWVMLAVATSHSARYAFHIITALFGAGIFLPIYLILTRATHHRPPGWRAVAKVFQRA